MIGSRPWDIKRLVPEGAPACRGRGTGHSMVLKTQSHAANPLRITRLDWEEDWSAARQPLHLRGGHCTRSVSNRFTFRLS